MEDTITPLERQLYFTTAHAHFKAGCPALALEVLSKLPSKVMETNGDDSPSMYFSKSIIRVYLQWYYNFLLFIGLLNSPSKIKTQTSEIDTGMLSWETSKASALGL